MLSRFFSHLSLSVLKLERNVYFLLRGPTGDELYPRTNVALEFLECPSCVTSFPNPLTDSVLWAVPKKRRSVEKRLNRKFGWPSQVWKPLVPKKHCITCKTCGDHFESGFLCSKCYSKVKTETQELHAEIEKEIGLKPIDKEVVILYKEENEEKEKINFQGKQIIEMMKRRPPWFSKNLLEKTTKGLASTLNVKSSDLA